MMELISGILLNVIQNPFKTDHRKGFLMTQWTVPLRYCRCLAEIDEDYLRSIEAKTLLVDLDNTLVFWHTTDCLPGVQEWLENRLEEGFEIFIFSNAEGKRAESFAHDHGIRSLPYAGKPWPFGVWHIKRFTMLPKENWVIIGDQIYTDILCGGLAGIKSLYVFPYSKKEWWWTRFVRRFERKLLISRGVISQK